MRLAFTRVVRLSKRFILRGQHCLVKHLVQILEFPRRTGHEGFEPKVFQKIVHICLLNIRLLLQIHLAADQDATRILFQVFGAFNLLDPVRLQAVKRLFVTVIEAAHKAVYSVVRQHPEVFRIIMASAVPNVQLNLLLLVCQTLLVTVEKRYGQRVSEQSLDVGLNHSGLANSGIPDDNDV